MPIELLLALAHCSGQPVDGLGHLLELIVAGQWRRLRIVLPMDLAELELQRVQRPLDRTTDEQARENQGHRDHGTQQDRQLQAALPEHRAVAGGVETDRKIHLATDHRLFENARDPCRAFPNGHFGYRKIGQQLAGAGKFGRCEMRADAQIEVGGHGGEIGVVEKAQNLDMADDRPAGFAAQVQMRFQRERRAGLQVADLRRARFRLMPGAQVVTEFDPVRRQVDRCKVGLALEAGEDAPLAVGEGRIDQPESPAGALGVGHQFAGAIVQHRQVVEAQLDPVRQMPRQADLFLVDQEDVVIVLVLVIVDQFDRCNESIVGLDEGDALAQLLFDGGQVESQSTEAVFDLLPRLVVEMGAQDAVEIQAQCQRDQNHGTGQQCREFCRQPRPPAPRIETPRPGRHAASAIRTPAVPCRRCPGSPARPESRCASAPSSRPGCRSPPAPIQGRRAGT